MIDALSNRAEAEKYIVGGLRIRTIIISHGDGDPYGGAQYLKDKYGAKLYMPALDNHPSYDDTAITLDKLRAMPDKPNPFFSGTENARRYLTVLKECNLNNWDVESATRPSTSR